MIRDGWREKQHLGPTIVLIDNDELLLENRHDLAPRKFKYSPCNELFINILGILISPIKFLILYL